MFAVADDVARERILAAATDLFAVHGYDGTSTRAIAERVALNVATVAYHVGGKRDLYLAVMERAHRMERAAVRDALAACTPDGAGVATLTDGYLDFCVAHPVIPALWMHRWLSDAADIADLEAAYVTPLIDEVVGVLTAIAAPGVDVRHAVWTVVWCTHGFCRGGVLDATGHRHRGEDPAALAAFRAHLHGLVAGLLRPPDR